MITCTDLADVVLELQSKGIIVRIVTDSKEIDASGSQIGRFRESSQYFRCSTFHLDSQIH